MTFRAWCQLMWYEHLDEFEGWFRRRPDYTSTDYFANYKYWLKREYKHRKQHGILIGEK
jgi:hypothetical protein